MMAKYIDAEAAKTGFVLSGQDLFGRYARIAYGHAQYGRIPGKQEYHIYKIVQSFQSNTYCDVPLTYQTEHNCYAHDEIVDVINVVHCGIDESRVIRVALKDVEILPAPAVGAVPVVRCKDCKHGIEEDGGIKCAASADYDEMSNDWFGFVSWHEQDWFCADGERKGGGAYG